MNWRILFVVSLVLILSNGKAVWADGDHPAPNTKSFQNGENTESSNQEESGGHEGMDMGEESGNEESGANEESGGHEEQQGGQEESSGTGEESGGHGGHGDVIETPANKMVLGTFGAINLSFILFGIWNKFLRR